ncbi:DMP19 family protein [Xanthomonas sp. AM6]|uniref:DMP19 family protein n=1 Tax=Xanthomonas sp. AM6 TaxID=2982531 RepID=UPI0021D7FF70|nr:DMP19 family protein [Xanthomonas sp. AM6]UYB52335.1 DMP19 family protein [Xanthomonas sp. AM6]
MEIMRFADAAKQDDPAEAVFMAAHALVFDKGDGITEHIDRLSPEARLVYLLWCFDGEVHNGGFDQLFTNSLGNHCVEILGHLQTVGASKSHALLSKAVSWFPNASPSGDRRVRWSQRESFSDTPEYEAEMDRLDAEFYRYEDNLGSLLNSYVAQHPDASIRA